MKNIFANLRNFFSAPSYSRTIALIGFFILIVALPITIIFLGQQTNLFQHAAEIGGGGGQTCTGTCYPTQCSYLPGYQSASGSCTAVGNYCCKKTPVTPTPTPHCGAGGASCVRTSQCSTVNGLTPARTASDVCGSGTICCKPYVAPTPAKITYQCVFPNKTINTNTNNTHNVASDSQGGNMYGVFSSSYSSTAAMSTSYCSSTQYCDSTVRGATSVSQICKPISGCTCDSTDNPDNNHFTCGTISRSCSTTQMCDTKGITASNPWPCIAEGVTLTKGTLAVNSNTQLCNNNQGVCITSASSINGSFKYNVSDNDLPSGMTVNNTPGDFTPVTVLKNYSNQPGQCTFNCVSIDAVGQTGGGDICQRMTNNAWHAVKSAQGDCQTFDTAPAVCCQPSGTTASTTTSTPTLCEKSGGKCQNSTTACDGSVNNDAQHTCMPGPGIVCCVPKTSTSSSSSGGSAPTTPSVCTDKPAQTNLVLSPVCSSGKIAEVKANFPAASGAIAYSLDWWFHRDISGKDEYNECAKSFTANGTAVGSYSNNAGGAIRSLGTSCFDSNAKTFGAAYRIQTKACTGPYSSPATYIPMTACQPTIVTLNVKLAGIGPAQFENATPAHPNRNNIGVVIFDQSGKAILRTTTDLTYASSSGLFVSQPINVGVLPYTTATSFKVYLGVPQFLKAFARKISSTGTVITLDPGTANTVTVYPLPGDIVDGRTGNLGQDDIINGLDYNVLRTCRNQNPTAPQTMLSGSQTITFTCGSVMNLFDYPDGGTTGDEWSFNYNLWVRSLVTACGQTNNKCTGD